MIAAGTDWQPYILLLALLIISFSLMMNARKRARRAAEGAPRRRSSYLAGGDEEKGLRRSMEKLLVELQEVSREINAQLDNKMRVLTQLTDQARVEIERLNRLLADAGAVREVQRQATPQEQSSVLAQAAGGAVSAVPTASPGAPPGAGLAGPPSAVAAAPPTDPRHRRVYELADAGLSAVEIARETHYSVGEVELILSLRAALPPLGKQPTAPRGSALDLRT